MLEERLCKVFGMLKDLSRKRQIIISLPKNRDHTVIKKHKY